MTTALVRTVCRGAICVVLPFPQNAYRPYALRHPILALLNALIIVGTLGASLALSLTPEIARLSTIAAPILVRLTNAERARAGLPALADNPLLARSAQLKGEHMLRHDYFEHTFAGLTPWAWFDRVGYGYTYAGENLAIDFLEAEDVVTAWLRSQGHRRNVLSQNYDEIGIAVVTGEFQGRTATVVVQHFGTRENRPPAAPAAPPAGPPPAVARARTVSPSPAPAIRPAVPPPLPTPLAAPRILEPVAGATIGSGVSTVRGTAPASSTVRVLLDEDVVGRYAAPTGVFRGTFTPPPDTERPSTLTAIAQQDGRDSPPSPRVRIVINTTVPPILPSRALFLPDPRGVPGTALLVLPEIPDRLSLATIIAGRAEIPLERHGTVATARLAVPLPDPVLIRTTDRTGTTRETTLSPLLAYATQGPPAGTPRAQVAAAVSRVRPILASALAVLAALLGANVLVHVRLHRLLHGDLFAHAVFVLGLGSTLVLF